MNKQFFENEDFLKLMLQEQYMGLTLEVYEMSHMMPIHPVRCNGYIGGEIVMELVKLGFDPYDEQLPHGNEITYKSWQSFEKTGDGVWDYEWVMKEKIEHFFIGFDHFHSWDVESAHGADPDYVMQECRVIAQALHDVLRELKQNS